MITVDHAVAALVGAAAAILTVLLAAKIRARQRITLGSTVRWFRRRH